MGMPNANKTRQGLSRHFRVEAFEQLPPGRSMWGERKRLRDRNSIGDNLVEIVEAPKPKENGRVEDLKELITLQSNELREIRADGWEVN
jgi:hypothetical protein